MLAAARVRPGAQNSVQVTMGVARTHALESLLQRSRAHVHGSWDVAVVGDWRKPSGR